MTATFVFQGSLLDEAATTPAIDRAFAEMGRHHLPNGAWVDRLPGWVQGADALYRTAEAALDWQAGDEQIRGRRIPRPRLVATAHRAHLPAELSLFAEMADALSERYGVRLDRITCNLYRDGRDSVAWHGDRIARDLSRTTVAVVSLGEPRPFRLRSRDGGPSLSWPVGHGDLVVMGGSCQRTCEHSVPKVASAGPRIAVMFRHAYPPEPASARSSSHRG